VQTDPSFKQQKIGEKSSKRERVELTREKVISRLQRQHPPTSWFSDCAQKAAEGELHLNRLCIGVGQIEKLLQADLDFQGAPLLA
jgi:hypothetical protein